jgi:two-component system nitrate/nitrite response regulator NarL
MPDLDGLEVLSALSTGRQTKVVLLTANASDGQILTAIARGIKGILLKDAAVPDLLSCIREVAAGGHWLPSDLIDAVLERETGRRMIGMRLAESLTSRERQIMSAVAEGVSNKVIAKRLGVSEGTVKIHLHHIYRKVDVANRTSLAALAIAHRDQLSGTEYPACSSPPRKNA